MIVLSLNGSGWTLCTVKTQHADAAVPAEITKAVVPATVPGCVHTDLMSAGLIPDPYLDRNELVLLWIGRTGWRYTRTFEANESLRLRDHVELACDGLDTLATVLLNGTEVGRTQDMHLRHRFDIKSLLKPGQNELVIEFDAPLPFAEAMKKQFGNLPATGGGSNPQHPHNYIRKMACNFGWDWGPVVITAGIWRDMRIEAWGEARIGDVRPLVVHADPEHAVIDLRVERFGAIDAQITYTLQDVAGALVARGECENESDLARAMIEVKRPGLWWPVGHGDQPLYTLSVVCGEQTVTHRIGLRTAELVVEADTIDFPHGRGEGMYFKINGKRIYAKGADWIPDDCFVHRVTRSRYRHRLLQARDANMNMLRIWGGGIFEDRNFYELCDELGIMVWQDFLTACAAYSEEEPYRSLMKAEAYDNTSRLCRHPSLVLLNGCNENLWGYVDWGWRELIGDRGWGMRYYFDIFPKAVRDVAPTVPYWPGSPSNGTPDILERHPNANVFGNRHVWDVWHGRGQYRNYLEHYPRFCSEFGFHGPLCWPTLERAIPRDQWQWNSPTMNLHNKNAGGDKSGQLQTQRRMADDFDPPEDFNDWLYLAQVMQARALSMGVEWFRALFPWNSGALYWQLNDCYPVSSWSAIDGDGRAKPLLYASRRFFADRLVTIKPRNVVPVDSAIGLLAVYLHNDHDDRWQGELLVRRMNLLGEALAQESIEIDVDPRGIARYDVPDTWHDDPAGTFLVAQVRADRGFWWFEPDKQMAYPTPSFDLRVSRSVGGVDVTIKAHTLLRDVCVFADRLDPDAVCSDQCFTLLPGEIKQLTISTKRPLKEADLAKPPVFQMANRFGQAPR